MNIAAILALPVHIKDQILTALLSTPTVTGTLDNGYRGAPRVAVAPTPPEPHEKPTAKRTVGNSRQAALIQVKSAVAATDGSASAICEALRLERGQVMPVVRTAVEAKALYKAGEKRFTRYGLTPEQAKDRAVKAQAGNKTKAKPNGAAAHAEAN